MYKRLEHSHGLIPMACGTNHYCHLIEFDLN